jgi:hypothetical protein
MGKILSACSAAAVLGAVAMATPAGATTVQSSQNVGNDNARVTQDFSAARRHHRHRRYYRTYTHSPPYYYGGPYYAYEPTPYYYGPRYYGPPFPFSLWPFW